MSADRTNFSQPVRFVFAARASRASTVVPRHLFLAASTEGAGGSRLLGSYDLERRHAAVRNTAYARRFADSLGRFKPEMGLEDDGATGERLRRGTRYGGSPVIVADGSTAPPDAANTYARAPRRAGGRAPHLWLGDGRSLFDSFGFEWSLLRLGSEAPAAEGLISAARRRRIDLAVVDVSPRRVSCRGDTPPATRSSPIGRGAA